MESLRELVARYIERVVNQRDATGVDEMVAADYRGSGAGWPGTIEELRTFYADQALRRPDWRIEIQETVELGDSVVVRARARGRVAADGGWRTRELDWLTHYRFAGTQIAEINLLTVVPRTTE